MQERIQPQETVNPDTNMEHRNLAPVCVPDAVCREITACLHKNELEYRMSQMFLYARLGALDEEYFSPELISFFSTLIQKLQANGWSGDADDLLVRCVQSDVVDTLLYSPRPLSEQTYSTYSAPGSVWASPMDGKAEDTLRVELWRKNPVQYIFYHKPSMELSKPGEDNCLYRPISGKTYDDCVLGGIAFARPEVDGL